MRKIDREILSEKREEKSKKEIERKNKRERERKRRREKQRNREREQMSHFYISAHVYLLFIWPSWIVRTVLIGGEARLAHKILAIRIIV